MTKIINRYSNLDIQLTKYGRKEFDVKNPIKKYRNKGCCAFLSDYIDEGMIKTVTYYAPIDALHISLEKVSEYLDLLKEAGFEFDQLENENIRIYGDEYECLTFYISDYVCGKHALAIYTALRYLTYHKFKGLPSAAIEMWKSGDFSAYDAIIYGKFWAKTNNSSYTLVGGGTYDLIEKGVDTHNIRKAFETERGNIYQVVAMSKFRLHTLSFNEGKKVKNKMKKLIHNRDYLGMKKLNDNLEKPKQKHNKKLNSFEQELMANLN